MGIQKKVIALFLLCLMGYLMLTFVLFRNGILVSNLERNEDDEMHRPEDHVPVEVKTTPLGERIAISFSRWYDGKRAALSLTCDDGQLPQATYVAPIAKQYGIPMTFYLSPVFFVDYFWEKIDETGTNFTRIREDIWKTFKILPLWQKYLLPLVQEGFHEYASHTCYHKSFSAHITTPHWYRAEDDFSDSIWFLKKVLGWKSDVVALAWPFGAHNQEYKQLAMEYFLSARGIACSFNDPDNIAWDNLYACDFESNQRYMDQKVEDVIKKGFWLIEFMHSVRNCGEVSWDECEKGYGDVDPKNFEAHLNFLTSKTDVWIAPVGIVSKFLREKEQTKILDHKEKHVNGRIVLEVQIVSNWNDKILKNPVPLTLEFANKTRIETVIHKTASSRSQAHFRFDPVAATTYINFIPIKGKQDIYIYL